jgi:hypothetical protein
MNSHENRYKLMAKMAYKLGEGKGLMAKIRREEKMCKGGEYFRAGKNCTNFNDFFA